MTVKNITKNKGMLDTPEKASSNYQLYFLLRSFTVRITNNRAAHQ